MSQDDNMINAYLNNQDLYAVIAQSMYNNNYDDNLEFYKEFTKLELDGKEIFAGTGKEYEYITENNAITIPMCYLLETPDGEVAANCLTVGQLIKSDIGWLEILSINKIQLNNVDNIEHLQIVFKDKIS